MLTKEPEMLQTMSFASIQYSKLQLQPGLCSEPRWSSGLYSASPDPLVGLRGSLRGVKGRRQGEGEEEVQEGREGKEGEGC